VNAVEYVGKDVLAAAGFNVPEGGVAASPEAAAAIARRLNRRVALKAQIPSGKRGKGGGILFADDPAAARDAAQTLLGSTIAGFAVREVLVEAAVPFLRECYAAVLNDPAARGPRFLFSASGGMDVEDVPADRMHQLALDIREPFALEAARALVRGSHAAVEHVEALARALVALYVVYRANDAELVEINPLVVTPSGDAVALDCKLVLDDSARKRHEELFARAEAALGEQGTELERRARALGLLYMELDGDVGVLANGAGLTMTTMDVIAHYGGRAANFMEIGGEAYTKATPALEIVLANPNVRSLLVNFCGAFAQTDVMARGVADAVAALKPAVPMVFTIHGTGEDAAIAIVRDELGIEPYDSMDDAVKAAIAAAR